MGNLRTKWEIYGLKSFIEYGSSDGNHQGRIQPKIEGGATSRMPSRTCALMVREKSPVTQGASYNIAREELFALSGTVLVERSKGLELD